ncbi:MAG: hypothetical protein ACQUYJ_03995 [Ferruginibacter sp.]|nr:hypothetical protein [Ferruginibacter sp.]
MFIAKTVVAQRCTNEDDLAKITGKFVDHNWTPAAGYISDYSTAEKTMALKTQANLEAICKKNFFGDGFVGKGSFGFKQGDYFNTLFLGTYNYDIGFYQLECINGQLKTAHEFGTNLTVTANPVIHPNLEVPINNQQEKFTVKGTRKDRPLPIPLFRYIVFTDKSEFEKTNTGTGYIDGSKQYHDAYDKNPDITRSWYITQQGTTLFTAVTRKEYLQSLLQFYEIEKDLLVQRQEQLLKIDRETIKLYEKNKDGKDKKDYQYFSDNIAAYEKDKAKAISSYTTKKNTVTNLLLSKPESWLQEAAVLNPEVMKNNYRCDDNAAYTKTGAHTFNDFYDNQKGLMIYKWNPEIFKQQPACSPVFFKVSVRYKEGIDISEAIKEYYTKNFDFAAVKKLLYKK